MLPIPYNGSTKHHQKAVRCMGKKPRNRTVCTVIRHIYSSTKDKSVRAECLCAIWNAKEVNRVLRHFNKQYSLSTALSWWRQNPYSPKAFTKPDKAIAAKLLRRNWDPTTQGLAYSFVRLYNMCDHRLREPCLEGLWMSSRMLRKLSEYTPSGR